jgi:UDP:flavonoid glycosyltransferase YjiC (YdhE family)
MTRVLLSTYGSAGDLFPLIPTIVDLREQGHEVLCAAPRPLGLYLRAAGLPMYALGDGTEMSILSDARLVTTRFDGWASWRVVAGYVRKTLAKDVGNLDRLIDSWRPQVVVTTNFAAAARIAAFRRGLPTLEVSLLPQHVGRLERTRSFGLDLRLAIAAICDLDPASSRVATLAWGSGSATLLHDPAVVGDLATSGPAVGFPYWDSGPERPGDADKAEQWASASSAPTLLVTLGSFLGASQRTMWSEVVNAVEELGVRAVCVGPRQRAADGIFDDRKDLLAVGYVPHSKIAPNVDVVVHHGGIGTMFAALHAGRSSVVVPQAFDQAHNGRLVEGLEVGAASRPGQLAATLASVVDNRTMTSRAQSLGKQLIPGAAAARSLTDRVLATAERS